MCDVDPSLNTCLNDPPAMLQKSQKPLTTHNVSDPSTIVPTPQPIGPPSLWAEAIISKQHLCELNASSTLFPEQLDKLLHDDKWIDQLKTLPEGDLVGLAGHLSNVWLTIVPTTPRSLAHRFSIVPIARVCHPGGVFACCGKLADPGRFSPQRMKYLTGFWFLLQHRSRSADSAMPTWGHSPEWMFVLNKFGYPPQAIRRQLDE